jgi:hypothetical protein
MTAGARSANSVNSRATQTWANDLISSRLAKGLPGRPKSEGM